MRRFTQTNPLSGYTPSVSSEPTYGQSAMTNNYGAFDQNRLGVLALLNMLAQQRQQQQQAQGQVSGQAATSGNGEWLPKGTNWQPGFKKRYEGKDGGPAYQPLREHAYYDENGKPVFEVGEDYQVTPEMADFWLGPEAVNRPRTWWDDNTPMDLYQRALRGAPNKLMSSKPYNARLTGDQIAANNAATMRNYADAQAYHQRSVRGHPSYDPNFVKDRTPSFGRLQLAYGTGQANKIPAGLLDALERSGYSTQPRQTQFASQNQGAMQSTASGLNIGYGAPSDSDPARGSDRFYFSDDERTAAPRPSSGQRPKKLNVSLFRGANKAPRPQNLISGYKKTLTPSDVEGLAARGYTPDTWPGNPYGHPALDFMTMNYGYKQPIMGHEISDWNPDFGKDVPNNGMFRMKQNTVQNLGRFQPAGKLPSLF